MPHIRHPEAKWSVDTLDKGWSGVDSREKSWNGDAAAAGITVNCRLSSIDRIALRRRMALAMLPRGAQVSYDCRRAPAPCAPLCVHTCTQVADEEYQSRVCDYVTLFFDSFFFLFLCFLRQQLFLGIGQSLISAKSLMAIRRRLIIISDRIEESWLFVILKCLIEKISIIIEIEVFDKE